MSNKKFYGLEDQEHLDGDPESVVEKAIDDACQKAGESFQAIAERIEWPIKVCVYRRMELPSQERIAAQVLENVLEWLDDAYGDPEGSATKPTENMKAAANLLALAIRTEYEPWACERTGEVVEYSRELAAQMFGQDDASA
jgi:hypothetical protein